MKGKINKPILILLIGLVTGIFFQFSVDERSVSEQEFRFKTSSPPFLKDKKDWADSVFNRLTREERFSQLMMVAAYPEKGKDDIKRVSELIRKNKVGGIIFFKGKPDDVARLSAYYQSLSRVPLLMAIDGEWGASMRLENTIVYPRQMMLGAIDDNEILYQMGRDIGRQLKLLGIHINFAPVIDVNNNPDNPVINSRSFGESRENVARKGILYMQGLQDEGIIAVAKHFPGHGDTDKDSHYELPMISHSASRLDSIELYPFKALIESGVCGIMTAHLNVPELDATPNFPATLSASIADSLLKKKLNFKGLVFTDAMTMKGVAGGFKPVEANIMALNAGNDILLMPGQVDSTLRQMLIISESTEVFTKEIEDRCKKILKAKAWSVVPTLKNRQHSDKELLDTLNSPYFELVRRQLIEKSLTIISNTNDLIPIKDLVNSRMLSIGIGCSEKNEFQESLSLYAPVDAVQICEKSDEKEIKSVFDTLAFYDIVIMSLHSDDQRVTKSFGLSPRLLQLADSLMTYKPVIGVAFTNPYLLRYLKKLEDNSAMIVAYENNATVQSLTAQLIFGAIPASGKLPVTISSQYKAGTGIKVKPLQRLKYSIPQEAGFDDLALLKVDSLVQDAILKKAMPGCQVLAAKNGTVFLNKSYGYHTYQQKRAVSKSDIYDLASLTKIIATIPAVMMLDAQNAIKIKEPLASYFHELDSTNKDKISIEDILLHQAGLKAWIPFYQQTLEPLFPEQKFISNKFTYSYPIYAGKNTFVNKHIKYREGCFTVLPDEAHTVHVAENLYMSDAYVDSIFRWIYDSELNLPPKYMYSDLGFYMLYRLAEDITGKKFEEFVDSGIYAPLGATHLTYLPLKKFDKEIIAPTENDIVFRKQVLQGYVHDAGAAMLGGVSGHAGLFSNANDLAKYMQMLLNGGTYGGKEYLSKKLIEKYTSCIECSNGNRRGLGFDKPEPDTTRNGPTFKGISSRSYGHTGFTGTMVWNDPSTGILYIFLSNRVYPDAAENLLAEMNVRTNVQKAIYDARVK